MTDTSIPANDETPSTVPTSPVFNQETGQWEYPQPAPAPEPEPEPTLPAEDQPHNPPHWTRDEP
jgi:hypothetical protein